MRAGLLLLHAVPISRAYDSTFNELIRCFHSWVICHQQCYSCQHHTAQRWNHPLSLHPAPPPSVPRPRTGGMGAQHIFLKSVPQRAAQPLCRGLSSQVSGLPFLRTALGIPFSSRCQSKPLPSPTGLWRPTSIPAPRRAVHSRSPVQQQVRNLVRHFNVRCPPLSPSGLCAAKAVV